MVRGEVRAGGAGTTERQWWWHAKMGRAKQLALDSEVAEKLQEVKDNGLEEGRDRYEGNGPCRLTDELGIVAGKDWRMAGMKKKTKSSTEEKNGGCRKRLLGGARGRRKIAAAGRKILGDVQSSDRREEEDGGEGREFL
ncbi:unnamed protein product [Amaranthus hypochondriacus]